MLTKEDLATLQFPFKAAEHEFLQGKTYITESAITSRIEEVDPSWKMEQISLFNRADSNQVVCTMRLTINDVWRDGVGMSVITKLKSGAGEANEAEKAAATDALKRAARLFGVGRYLLDLPARVKDVESLREYLTATYSHVPNPLSNAQLQRIADAAEEGLQTLIDETTPTAPQPPPAVTAPASKATEAEAPRVAELRNEMLTITRIEARSDSKGWYGYGLTDGLETRVNLFAPEDPKKITDAGYKWVTSGAVNWPVILKIQDNRIRIDTVTPAEPQNAGKETVDSFVVNLTQANKPYLIFKYGDNYAYSYTREPFRKAGYDVTGWDAVGNHEMPTPAEIVVAFDKQQKRLIVQSVVMVDVFDKQVAS